MPHLDRKELQKRRLRGAKFLRAGYTVAKVARRLGVSWSAAKKWQHIRKSKGEAKLRSPENQFRKPPLDKHDLRRIAKALRRSPKQEGFADCAVWTLPLVALLIARIAHYGQKVSRYTARRVLHYLGFKCGKMVGRPRKDATSRTQHWSRDKLEPEG